VVGQQQLNRGVAGVLEVSVAAWQRRWGCYYGIIARFVWLVFMSEIHHDKR
jgi:hypothetical protein